MIGGLILYVRAPSLDHFVFENKNVKILFRFCRRHYFDLRIIQGTVDIPYKYVNTVKKGKNVSIELEGYDTEMYGAANGTITATMHTPRQTAAGSMFTAQVKVTDCKYKIIGGMTGTASILVSNESVLQRILQRITNIM